MLARPDSPYSSNQLVAASLEYHTWVAPPPMNTQLHPALLTHMPPRPAPSQIFNQLVAASSEPHTPQCFLLTPKLLSGLNYRCGPLQRRVWGLRLGTATRSSVLLCSLPMTSSPDAARYLVVLVAGVCLGDGARSKSPLPVLCVHRTSIQVPVDRTPHPSDHQPERRSAAAPAAPAPAITP